MEPASGAAPSLAEPMGYVSILEARRNRQLSATPEETSGDEGDAAAEEPRKSASPSKKSKSRGAALPKLSLEKLLCSDAQGVLPVSDHSSGAGPPGLGSHGAGLQSGGSHAGQP